MPTVWDDVLALLRVDLDAEDFRRWFGSTAYASDSGDQITVWVPSESIRRHLTNHYDLEVTAALKAVGRQDTHVRFLVAGFGDEDDDEDD
jgi:chromosomal replication initiation ATPase DnaA